MWDLDGESQHGVAPDSPRQDGDATLAEHDHRLEWINAIVTRGDDEDDEECSDRARQIAVAEFCRRHPGVDLAQ